MWPSYSSTKRNGRREGRREDEKLKRIGERRGGERKKEEKRKEKNRKRKEEEKKRRRDLGKTRGVEEKNKIRRHASHTSPLLAWCLPCWFYWSRSWSRDQTGHHRLCSRESEATEGEVPNRTSLVRRQDK